MGNSFSLNGYPQSVIGRKGISFAFSGFIYRFQGVLITYRLCIGFAVCRCSVSPFVLHGARRRSHLSIEMMDEPNYVAHSDIAIPTSGGDHKPIQI